ncbi:hypothetical protein IJM86_06285 [bacterium]|nr:hypothetical protein [bacterium]
MNTLNTNINALPDNTNLKKLLTAMNDVANSNTGEGTQSLQFFLYTQLTGPEKQTFLEKNIKGTLKPKLKTYNNGENVTQAIFDGMKGKNTMLTFINVANDMIKNYNTNKQDIDNSNQAFQALLGGNGNESYIADAQKEIEADMIKKKEAAQEQADIQQQLQGMDDFINSFSSAQFKEDGTITQAQRNAMAEKNVNFQSKY